MTAAPTITALSPNAKRAARYDVYVDGVPLATVSAETIAQLELSVGRAFEVELAARVADESAVLAICDWGLELLARRPRAVAELRRQLLRSGEPAALVERAIARLLAGGLLDDAAFARAFARSRLVHRGAAPRRVRAELAVRGVAANVASAAIAQVLDEEALDPGATLDRVARRKLRTLAGATPDVRRRRLYAFLARRGYDADDVRRTVARLAGETERDAPA